MLGSLQPLGTVIVECRTQLGIYAVSPTCMWVPTLTYICSVLLGQTV